MWWGWLVCLFDFKFKNPKCQKGLWGVLDCRAAEEGTCSSLPLLQPTQGKGVRSCHESGWAMMQRTACGPCWGV